MPRTISTTIRMTTVVQPRSIASFAILLVMSLTVRQSGAADVSTAEGATLSGEIVAFDSRAVTIETAGESKAVPIESVLEIRWPASNEPPAGDAAVIGLSLRSGGELTCREVVVEDRVVVAESVEAGKLRLPFANVAAIRFRATDAAVEANWAELVQSAPDRDLLVVRNGDVLDRLDGTLSGLDPQTLTFLVGDQQVPVERSKPKLFGLVFGRAEGQQKVPIGELKFRNGDRLPVSSLSLDGENFRASLGDVSVTIRVDAVAAIDLGRGKVKFLSDMKPQSKDHTPYVGDPALDSVFDVLNDHSDAGPEAPIHIGRQAFQRGLVIHSRTKLVYRLGGDYQRFVAVAGIEQLVRPRGDLDLVISADGKELFRQNIKGNDEPIPLDLDVTGVRDLTIFVDFAGDSDISDHLALGDARVIK